MNFRGIEICCPRCRGELRETLGAQHTLHCTDCSHTYPVVAGIPDLRVFPDPYLDAERDRRKGEQLDALSGDLDFAGMVEHYYTTTSVVPPLQARRFTRNLLAAADRAAATLSAWDTAQGSARDEALLEIGCGTAPMLLAASTKYRRVIGIDIAFRWLVVAKKRLSEAGRDVPLICACAEALPFPGGSFDRVVGDSVIEHLKDQEVAVREAYRVMCPGARLLVITPNRFSLGPDPHVGLPAAGLIPEKWIAGYIRARGGIPPARRLLSARSLRRVLVLAGFANLRIQLPDIPAAQQNQFGHMTRMLIGIYHIAKRLPAGRQLLQAIGPMLKATAARPLAVESFNDHMIGTSARGKIESAPQ